MNATTYFVSSALSRPALGETSCETDNEGSLRLLIDSIAELPGLPKRILALYYSEGLRFSEIAEVFGLNESQVRQIHQEHVTKLHASIRQSARNK